MIPLSSCESKKKNPIEKKIITYKIDSVNEEKEINKNEKWVESTKIDTTLIFKNAHIVNLKNTDSILISEYYLKNKIIDSLTSKYNNSHQKALEIEKHLLKENEKFVKKDSFGLHLKMKNGNWKLIDLKINSDESDNTFEYYFQEFGFYSVRTQWSEGNGYKLINDTDGKVTDLFGRPYFSINGNFLVSVNADIDAGYSRNGFQLFKNKNGEIENLGSYEPNGWGFISAKWIDSNNVIFRNETFGIKNGIMDYVYYYTKMEIKNGG